ncbi:type 1 glutamine amidotransferase [Streptomyces sp. A7024]|uniref:Type 1 glutamine amidotransferase n=1 Tax=Streptomyces coryli TaxID=1128680 RepID=A0A6G4U2L1_9ACTN|nr:type 1 glutamine amidotransferase [Streptomyces coryli]
MPRVLVIQNAAAGGPRRFGEWLVEGGLDLDVVHPYEGGVLPDDLSGHHALIALGGSPMPDDDAAMPWLAQTRALAREALERGVPYFGICQGAQVLALVAGGEVRASHGEPEIGSTALVLRGEAADDPLLRGLPERVTAIERHKDQVTVLPSGAAWLAESERCPHQAFRCGEVAWGVQFHPEVSAGRVRAAWDAERLRELGCDPDEVVRAAERDEAAAAFWMTSTRGTLLVTTSVS